MSDNLHLVTFKHFQTKLQGIASMIVQSERLCSEDLVNQWIKKNQYPTVIVSVGRKAGHISSGSAAGKTRGREMSQPEED